MAQCAQLVPARDTGALGPSPAGRGVGRGSAASPRKRVRDRRVWLPSAGRAVWPGTEPARDPVSAVAGAARGAVGPSLVPLALPSPVGGAGLPLPTVPQTASSTTVLEGHPTRRTRVGCCMTQFNTRSRRCGCSLPPGGGGSLGTGQRLVRTPLEIDKSIPGQSRIARVGIQRVLRST